ncbi:MAG: TrpB-like pyridoxal phosphate-dependent enzyme [Candidatus Bathyarchaeota archaeon]|nr:MAG: TrpB-like pyridoxal phosphate-dependent enzyme [Candidatus Bathyarchaeota archaeon]
MDRKILLTEDQIPKKWYCILPDLPRPLQPILNPGTLEPVDPKMLEAIFPKELLKQEMSGERFVQIPEEIRDVYRLYRPTPMYRARGLEKALKTPAKIYYKYEGVSPPGSHKPNTAVAQAYYNMKEGVEKLTTETGAGQWGSSLAFGGAFFDIDVEVYMVRISYEQKPYRRVMMQLYGADVYPSPSDRTDVGKKLFAEDPECTGSLGIAISEAVEACLKDDRAKYSLGSVLNHVLMHQTVIGQEAKEQLAMVEEYPDKIIGCVGGGSSFAGLFEPFYYDKVMGKAPKEVDFTAVESTACPSMSAGKYMYDHGDTGRIIPLVLMHTLGHDFVPDPIHAGGLRYHGMAPTLSLMANEGAINVSAHNQTDTFEAAALFTRTEGIVPAPEPSHAIKEVVDEAIRCKETGEEKTLLFLLCGHGHFDMKAYDDYLAGKLQPYEMPKEKIDASLNRLKAMYPEINK